MACALAGGCQSLAIQILPEAGVSGDAGAHRDAGSSDAGVRYDSGEAHVDASTDAGSDSHHDGAETGAHDAQVETGTFCSTVGDAAFCADFDESISLIAGWTSTPSPLYSNGSGSLSLDDAIAISKPASLHAAVPALTTNSPGTEQFLQEDLASPRREVTLDFDFYIASVPKGAGLSVMSFTFNGQASVGVGMTLGTGPVSDSGATGGLGYAAMTTGDASAWLYDGYSYTPGSWIHATFDLLPTTSGGKLLVSFNGTLVQSWTGIAFASDEAANDLSLKLGLSQYRAFTPACDIHYDNVVIRFP